VPVVNISELSFHDLVGGWWRFYWSKINSIFFFVQTNSFDTNININIKGHINLHRHYALHGKTTTTCMEVKGQARRAVTGVVTILSSQYERLAPICYIWCILVTPNTAGACVTYK